VNGSALVLWAGPGLTQRRLVSTLKQSPERRRYGCDRDEVLGDRAGYEQDTEPAEVQ
jgi:hypothetical protein